MTTSALASAKSFNAQLRPSTPGRLKSGAVAPSDNEGKLSAARERLRASATVSDAINGRFIRNILGRSPPAARTSCSKEKYSSASAAVSGPPSKLGDLNLRLSSSDLHLSCLACWRRPRQPRAIFPLETSAVSAPVLLLAERPAF